MDGKRFDGKGQPKGRRKETFRKEWKMSEVGKSIFFHFSATWFLWFGALAAVIQAFSWHELGPRFRKCRKKSSIRHYGCSQRTTFLSVFDIFLFFLFIRTATPRTHHNERTFFLCLRLIPPHPVFRGTSTFAPFPSTYGAGYCGADVYF